MRLRIAEVSEYAIPHVPRDDALIPGDNFCNAGVIGADYYPQVLRIKTGRKCRRAHQIAKHYCKLTPLGAVPGRRFGARLGCSQNVPLKFCDRAQHLAAMSKQDAKVLEILLREIAEDREVNGVLAEALSVLSQTDRC